MAHPGKNSDKRLVGTWDQVVSEVTTPDGKSYFRFGERPKAFGFLTAMDLWFHVHIGQWYPR